MTTLKTLIVVTALVANETSLVVAQNGPPTSGQLPVAGGAAGTPAAPDLASDNFDPNCSSSRDTAPQNVHDVGEPHP
jgi:hypothetical protein